MHDKRESLVGNHQIKCYHYVQKSLGVQLALEVPELLNLPSLLSNQLVLEVPQGQHLVKSRCGWHVCACIASKRAW